MEAVRKRANENQLDNRNSLAAKELIDHFAFILAEEYIKLIKELEKEDSHEIAKSCFYGQGTCEESFDQGSSTTAIKKKAKSQ